MRFARLPVLVVVCALVVAAGCGDTAPDIGGSELYPRSIPVVALPVRFEPESRRFEAVGTSRAVRSVELHPEAQGKVEQVSFEGGEHVATGEVLVALDARDERLAVELAQVALADAELQFRRYEEARRGEAVPPTTLDAARTALESARIELHRARVTLDRRYVRAPFDGIVGMTDVEPGDWIDPTTLITTVDDRSALWVFFEVPEALVGRIAPGDDIDVETWTADRQRATGRVVNLGSRIDPLSRSFTVRARIGNQDDRLRPGMSFRILLELDGGVWPAVPEVALQWGASGPYVWAVREGRAERVEARVVQRRQGRVLIDAELATDDRIVAEGVQRMRQGVPVRSLDPEALARDARGVLMGEAARQEGLATEPVPHMDAGGQ